MIRVCPPRLAKLICIGNSPAPMMSKPNAVRASSFRVQARDPPEASAARGTWGEDSGRLEDAIWGYQVEHPGKMQVIALAKIFTGWSLSFVILSAAKNLLFLRFFGRFAQNDKPNEPRDISHEKKFYLYHGTAHDGQALPSPLFFKKCGCSPGKIKSFVAPDDL
jgi:hypothetical protein